MVTTRELFENMTDEQKDAPLFYFENGRNGRLVLLETWIPEYYGLSIALCPAEREE